MTVIIAVAVLLVAAVLLLRSMVTSRFNNSDVEVLSYEAARSTISTTVSGSGVLSGVDMESVVLSAGVEINEVLIRSGRSVAQGDVMATVNMTTVISTLSSLQEKLEALDEEIGAAEGDKVSSIVKAGIALLVLAGSSVLNAMYYLPAIVGMPKYLRCLHTMKNCGLERTSSAQIAQILGSTPSQVRQNLSAFGSFGSQGYGYNIKHLIQEIHRILGLTRNHTIAVIGVGGIGHALLEHMDFEEYNYNVCAAFV